MFDNRPIEIDNEISSSREPAGTGNSSGEIYLTNREGAERLLRKNISEMPCWRRRIIETALKGGW